MVHFVGDRIGELAQQCFHIEKIGDKYYFILDLDEDKLYSKQSDSERMCQLVFAMLGKTK